MTMLILNLTAVVLYCITGFVLGRRLFAGPEDPGAQTTLRTLAATAIVIHGTILYFDLTHYDSWNVSITHVFSMITCAIAAVYFVISLRRPIEILGAAVMPAAAVAILAAWFSSGEPESVVDASSQFTVHLIVSVLAFAFLSLAVVQALLLNMQEKRLRERDPGRLITALPPLQTMEGMLFVLTGIGFLLLTLTLISGSIYTKTLFGVPFTFDHHTVLTIVAWIMFGVLLLGHFRFGWRGRYATNWIIGGFFVLILAYFGTKYVSEILLT